jgi:glycosyltransferase involved in cell wall biosynthesis
MCRERVTVVIPCYNAEKYLELTLKSILNQTFSDYIVKIIDDGCTDDSVNIIKDYMIQDARIQLYRNNGNKGIAYTRNYANTICDSEYIAYMDSDDIAPDWRLQEEVDYLDSHPDIDAVSGGYQLIDEAGTPGLISVRDKELSPAGVRRRLIMHNPIANGSVMLRRSTIDNRQFIFREDFICLEDYMFWAQYSLKHNMVVLPRILQYYRVNMSGNSKTTSNNQLEERNRIFDKIHEYLLDYYGINLSDEDKKAYLNHIREYPDKLGFWEKRRGMKAIKRVEEMLDSIDFSMK